MWNYELFDFCRLIASVYVFQERFSSVPSCGNVYYAV